MPAPNTLQIIRQWQSETDAITEAPEPKAVQSAVLLLAAAIVATLGVTPFVTLDRVVSSTAGKLVSSAALVTVQALDPSIIKAVDVREGQVVRKGDTLAALDATFAQADVGALRRQLASSEAEIARLVAEQDGAALRFGDAPGATPTADEQLQLTLFDRRAAAFASEMRLFDEKTKTAQATVDKLTRDEALLTERANISTEVATMRDTLYQSGASSKLNLLLANDARLEAERSADNTRNSLVEARHQLSQLAAERESYAQKWSSDVAQALVTARATRDTTVGSLSKASRHQDLVALTAPGDAVVLTLSKLSVGSVLREGDTLMTLAPLNAPMEAEIRIAPRDIGFLRVGDPVSLKVDAFNFYEHGSASGHVAWISDGTFATDDGDKPVDPFYKAHVAIDRTDFANVPANFRLLPGMTLRADATVGQRSLFRYLMGGFVRGTGEAMREP